MSNSKSFKANVLQKAIHINELTKSYTLYKITN